MGWGSLLRGRDGTKTKLPRASAGASVGMHSGKTEEITRYRPGPQSIGQTNVRTLHRPGVIRLGERVLPAPVECAYVTDSFAGWDRVPGVLRPTAQAWTPLRASGCWEAGLLRGLSPASTEGFGRGFNPSTGGRLQRSPPRGRYRRSARPSWRSPCRDRGSAR